MRPFRLSIAALAVAAALGIAACGDDDDASDSGFDRDDRGRGRGAHRPVQLLGEGRRDRVQVLAGEPEHRQARHGTFAVTNDGQVPHALEVEGPDGEAETDTIEPGKSDDLKVDLGKAGTYEWYCPIGNHKEQGMKGEITVAGGGSGKAASDGRGQGRRQRR